MALAGLEVVRIVRRSDFHRAGAEFAVHRSVRDYWNFAIRERQHYFFTDQALVALVVRVHGDRGIAQHRFRARGRDDDVLFRSGDRVANVPKAADALIVNDL